jgi:hypothetical protein
LVATQQTVPGQTLAMTAGEPSATLRDASGKSGEDDMMDGLLADGAIGSTVAFGAINLGSSPSPPASFPISRRVFSGFLTE